MANPLNDAPTKSIDEHIKKAQAAGANGLESELNKTETTTAVDTGFVLPSQRQDAEESAVTLAEQDLRNKASEPVQAEEVSPFITKDYATSNKSFIKVEELKQRNEARKTELLKARQRARQNLSPEAARQGEEELKKTLTPSQYAAMGNTTEEASVRYSQALSAQLNEPSNVLASSERNWVDAEERGTVLGELKSAALNLGSGITRVGTGIVTLLPTISKEINLATSKADAEDIAKFKRINQEGYTPTEEDLAFINTKEYSELSRYFKSEATIEWLKSPEKFLSGRLPTAERNRVMANLRNTWNEESPRIAEQIENNDVFGFIGSIASIGVDGFKAVLESPSTLTDSIVETLPDVVLAAKSLSLGLASTITQQQQAALEEFIAKYGEMPTGDKRLKLNGYATLAGVLDLVGDRLIAQGGRLLPTSKTTSTLTDNYAANILKGTAGEAFASGSSGALMGKAIDDEYDGARAFEGAITGAASAGVQTAVTAAGQPLGTAKKVLGKVYAGKEAAPKEQQVESVENIVSTPVKVEDPVRNEAITAGQTELTQALEPLKQAKAELDAEPDNSIKQVELVSKAIAYIGQAAQISENVPELSTALAPDRLAAKLVEELGLDEGVTKTVGDLVQAVEQLRDQGTTDVDINTLITQTYGNAFSEAVDGAKVLNDLATVALYSKDLSVEDTQSILDLGQQTNTLSSETITGLTDVIERKTAEQVGAEVKSGTEGNFIGYETHVSNINDALQRNDVEGAQASYGALTNFQSSQQAKLDWLSEATAIRRKEVASKVPTNKQTILTNSSFTGLMDDAPLSVGVGESGLKQAYSLRNIVRSEVDEIDIAVSNAETLLGQRSQQAEQTPVVDEIVDETPAGTQGELFPDTKGGKQAQIQWLEPDDTVTTDDMEQAGQLTIDDAIIDNIVRPKNIRAKEWGTIKEGVLEKGFTAVRTELETELNTQESYSDVADESAVITEQLKILDKMEELYSEDAPAEVDETPAHLKKMFDSLVTFAPEDASVDDKRILGNFIKETFKPVDSALTKAKGLFERVVKGDVIEDVYADTGIDTSKANNEDFRLIQELIPLRKDFRLALNQVISESRKSVLTSIETGKYRYKNPLTLLMDSNNQLPSSVVDAMFVAGMHHLLGDGSTNLNDETTIMSMLGIDSRDREVVTLSNDALELFGNAGSDMLNLHDSIGKSALAMSGIKPTTNTSRGDVGGLIKSLGMTAVNTLVELGVVTKAQIDGNKLNDVKTQISQTYDIDVALVAPSGDSVIGPVHIQITDSFPEALADTAKRATGIFNKLVDRENAPKKPSIGIAPDPIAKGARILRSNQQVTPAGIEAHNKAINTPFYVNKTTAQMLTDFGDDFFKKIRGWVDTSDENQFHPKFLESQVGSNQSIELGLEATKELILKTGGDSTVPIYYDYGFISNGRHQQRGTGPQSDKTVRHMVGLAPATISMRPNSKYIDLFKLAIGQALDLKFDKKSNEDVINRVNEIINNDGTETGINGQLTSGSRISLAVQEMVKYLDDSTYPVNQEILLLGIEAGGEKMHSFKGIVELARFLNAKAIGAESFTTDITVENDGVTNGPFNATMAMGATELFTENGLAAMAQRGGLTVGAAEPVQHNETLGKGELLDTYQTTSREAAVSLNGLIEGYKKDIEVHGTNKGKGFVANIKLTAATALARLGVNQVTVSEDGNNLTFDYGRNSAKNPVTVTIYGSSKGGINKKITKGYVDNFYIETQEVITKLLSGNYTEADLRNYLNIIANYGDATWGRRYKNGKVIAENKEVFGRAAYNSIVEFMSGTGTPESVVGVLRKADFTKSQISVLEGYVETTIGSALNSSIEATFSTLKSRMTKMNLAVNIVHNLFAAEYDSAYVARQKELVEAGELHKSQRLTAKQESDLLRGLSNISPIFQTALSTGTADGFMASTETTSNATYSGESNVATYIGFGKGTERRPDRQVYKSPGVRAAAMMIINIDASMQILNNIYNERSSGLNVYDAMINTLDNMGDKSKTANIAAYQALRDTNPLHSVGTRLKEVIKNNSLINDKDIPENVKQDALMDILGGTYGLEPFLDKMGYGVSSVDMLKFINSLADDLINTGYKTQLLKEEALKNSSFDQINGYQSALLIEEGNITNVSEDLPALKGSNASRNSKRNIPNTKGSAPAEARYDIGKTKTIATFNNSVDSSGKVFPDVLGDLVEAIGDRADPLTKKILTDAVTNYPDMVVQTGSRLYDAYGNKVKALFKKVKGVPTIYLNTDFADIEANFIHEIHHLSTDSGMAQGIADMYAKRKSKLQKVANLQLSILDKFYKANWMDKDLINNYPEIGEVFRLYKEYLNSKDAGSLYRAMQEMTAYGMSETGLKLALQKTQLTAQEKGKGIIKNFVLSTLKMVAGYLGYKGVISVKTYYDILLATSLAYAESVGEGPDTNTELYSRDLTATDIFDKLIPGSDLRSNQLRSILEDIDKSLLQPVIDKFASTRVNARDDYEHAFMDALNPNISIKANSLQSAGFKMTSQESMVYQLQAEALNHSFENKYYTTLEAKRLFKSARKQLSPESFLPEVVPASMYDAELRIAKAKYEAIFNIKRNPDGYLGNFLAMATVNTEFKNLLNTLSTPEIQAEDAVVSTFGDRIKNVYDKVVQALSSKILGTSPQVSLGNNLTKLANNIVAIKTRKSNLLNNIQSVQKRAESFLNGGIKGSVSAVAMALKNNKSDSILGKAAIVVGTPFAALANDEVKEAYLASINDLGFSFGTGRLNVASELVNSMLGQTRATTRNIDTLRRRKVAAADATRQNTKDEVPKIIRSKFSKLEEGEEAALTKVVLSGDLNSLISYGISMKELTELLQDPAKVKIKLNTVLAELKTKGVSSASIQFMSNQARMLGKTMVTGESYVALQLPNAWSIANMVGTRREGTLPETTQASLVPVLDAIASLSAISHMGELDKATVANMILREHEANGALNGVTYVMRKYKSLIDTEYSRHGENAKWVIPKGYTHELLNPHKSVTYANQDSQFSLRHKGYAYHAELPLDKADPGRVVHKAIFVSDEAGSPNWVQTAMSTIELTLGGTSKGRPLENSLPSAFGAEARQVLKNKRADIDKLFTTNVPDNISGRNYMRPTLDKTGRITSFNYKLDNAKKDALLDRNNDMSIILGSWDARIKEESVATTFNNELVAELGKQWKTASELDKKKFIKVHAKATDKVVSEAWNMMPNAMRSAAKTEFGGKFIMVDRRDFNNAFGYREFTMTSVFDTPKEGKLGDLQKTMAYLATALLGKNAFNRLRLFERGLQETITQVKDFIVIRSVVVPMGNLLSNIMQLHLRGVNIHDIRANGTKGLNAAKEYKNIIKGITLLEETRRVGQYDNATEQEITQELERLYQDLKNSPVHEMVEAGLMPTIVEDLNEVEGSFTIKETLLDKITPNMDRVISNPIAKELLVSPGSGTYRTMEEMTSLGDFVARFTLYKHLTSGPNAISKEKALEQIAYDFIDYGAPDSIAMDYMNKMGILHFTKWFLRIQPVLISMIRENPARILAFVGGQSISGMDITSPYDAYIPETDLGNKTGIGQMLSMGMFTQPVFNVM